MIHEPEGGFENFLSSLGLVADCSEASCLAGEHADMLSGINTANQFFSSELATDTWMTPQSLETSEILTKEDMRKPMLDELTYSAQASRASHSRLQGSSEATTTPETSGQIPYEPFAWYDRATSSWKTCLGCFREILVTSEPYLETWPKTCTVLDMVAYRLPKQVLPINETGSGLWATPIRSDAAGCVQSEKALAAGWGARLSTQAKWGTPRNCTSMAAEINESRANHKFPNLETQVAQTYWPTPHTDAGHERPVEFWANRVGKHQIDIQGAVKLYPTPSTVDGGSYFNKSKSAGAANRPTLGAMARFDLWPTPSAQPPGWKHIEVVDKDGNPPDHPNQRFYDKATGRLVQKGLEQVVGMWPTPSANKTTRSTTEPSDITNSKGEPIQRGEKPYLNGKPIQTALGDAVSWPTPTTRDWKDSGQAVAEGRVPVNCLLGRAVWPTPHSGGRAGVTNGGHAGLASSAAMRKKLAEHGEEGKKMGSQALNPDWVEWLMNMPIGWSNIEPCESYEFWLANQDVWWLTDPADAGFIPRVTPQKTNRVNRLKCLGNGQVPICMAYAWLNLQVIPWTESRVIRHVKVKRDEVIVEEVIENDLFNF